MGDRLFVGCQPHRPIAGLKMVLRRPVGQAGRLEVPRQPRRQRFELVRRVPTICSRALPIASCQCARLTASRWS